MNPLSADEVNPVLLHTTAKEATEASTTAVQVLMCLRACRPSALSVHFSSCAFALEVNGKSCRPCAGACNWSLQGYRIAGHFKSSNPQLNCKSMQRKKRAWAVCTSTDPFKGSDEASSEDPFEGIYSPREPNTPELRNIP